MKTCSVHKTYVPRYAGTIKQLARELADLRYDALRDFLSELGEALAADSRADEGRGRVILADHLRLAARRVSESSCDVSEAWNVSKPHMDINDEPPPRRIVVQSVPKESLKEGDEYLVCFKDGEHESWMIAAYRGGLFYPDDGASFVAEPPRYFVFSHPWIGPRSDKTYHVSGHVDLTEAEFKEHYVPLLDEAISEGARFVVGDAKGADAMAFDYLDERTSRVVMYHMFTSPRNDSFVMNLKGGYKSDEERDAAMTADSDEDIAWIRPGREKSGTAKNLQRRKEKLDGKG